MVEITDDQKSVLEIKFDDGDRLYLNRETQMGVSNPYHATKYLPNDVNHPEREKIRSNDLKWIKSSCIAEISFVPYPEAFEEYLNRVKTYFSNNLLIVPKNTTYLE